MNVKQEQHYQLDDGQQPLANSSRHPGDDENPQRIEEMFPGIPIVRGNTPRPLSFHSLIASSSQFAGMQQASSGTMPAFPSEAPSAPPLPEELIEEQEEPVLEPVLELDEEADFALSEAIPASRSGLSDPIPASDQPGFVVNAHDFIWLFEYGLEMDAAILNSPERLDSQAVSYGPAVLRGYKVAFGAQYIRGDTGPTIIAIEPDPAPDAEVWGVLYRVPRRLFAPGEWGPSLLDTIHAAITPQNFFKGVQVVVHEIEHDRDVTGVVYVATTTAHQQLHLVSIDQWSGDGSFALRLAAIARQQKLPEYYVSQYEALASQPLQPPKTTIPPEGPAQTTVDPPVAEYHDTGPRPTLHKRMSLNMETARSPLTPQINISANRWLTIFSLYLAGLLLMALTFAGLQGLGLGHKLAGNQFNPLGVPWLVLMYGLLGGCVSCIVTLGRFRTASPPAFIVISWFTRPFIGVLLAVLAFLLLTSGIFAFDSSPSSITQHMALFLLVGALAGFAEGWLFFRKV